MPEKSAESLKIENEALLARQEELIAERDAAIKRCEDLANQLQTQTERADRAVELHNKDLENSRKREESSKTLIAKLREVQASKVGSPNGAALASPYGSKEKDQPRHTNTLKSRRAISRRMARRYCADSRRNRRLYHEAFVLLGV